MSLQTSGRTEWEEAFRFWSSPLVAPIEFSRSIDIKKTSYSLERVIDRDALDEFFEESSVTRDKANLPCSS